MVHSTHTCYSRQPEHNHLHAIDALGEHISPSSAFRRHTPSTITHNLTHIPAMAVEMSLDRRSTNLSEDAGIHELSQAPSANSEN